MMDLTDVIFTKALFGGGENVPEWDGSYVMSGDGGDWIGDGNTHIWISLPKERKSPMLGVYVYGTVTVDWGDGSTPDVLTGGSATRTVKWTPAHNYAAAGDYVITLTVDGTMGVGGSGGEHQGSYLLRQSTSAAGGNYAYVNAVRKVELGNSVTSIGDSAFLHCYSLTSINIPDSVKSIGNYAFRYCYSLTSINIPDSVTSIGSSAFDYCTSLTNITIPDGVTSLDFGAVYNCYSLTSINIPDSVTSIGGSAFGNSYGLVSINMPASVTSIGSSAFQWCRSLTSINIPDSVTSIGGSAFGYCYSLAKIRLEGTTPPVVASSNAFTNIPTDCIISVPVGSLEAYKTATNYPDPAKYTYVEE